MTQMTLTMTILSQTLFHDTTCTTQPYHSGRIYGRYCFYRTRSMRRALAVSSRLTLHTGHQETSKGVSRTLSSFPSLLSQWHKDSGGDERSGSERIQGQMVGCNEIHLRKKKALLAGLKGWERSRGFSGDRQRRFVTMMRRKVGRRKGVIVVRTGLGVASERTGLEREEIRWGRGVIRNLSTGTTKGESKEIVTWRQAVRSPRKAAEYMVQVKGSVVAWGSHMWSGAKLLAADVRGSWKILKRILKGKQISRRERHFIVQTGVDVARLVPFSLFLIIPAAEFALPFALKLFPNMLPSQFQDEMKKEEDMKKSLKVKLELAKYLRDVVEEKAKVIKEGSHVDSAIKKDAEDLRAFLEAIRRGNAVDPKDVPRFARLFNDEITIEGAVRPQLVAMCKYMGISPYGADQFLRYKIRSRLNSIKNDDMQIMWEGGVESLTDDEVVKACRDRGIRTMGSSNRALRRQLAEWLALSQDKEIPGSLMIMSRAFFYVGEEGVKETLGSLPEDVLQDVKKAAGGDEVTNEDRLEEVRRQEKLIAIEEDREARKEKEAAEAAQKKLEESREGSATPKAPLEDVLEPVEAARAEEAREEVQHAIFGKETGADTATHPETSRAREDEPKSGGGAEIIEEGEEELAKQKEAIRRVAESLGDLSAESAVEKERLALEELKSEVADAEAALSNIGEKKEIGLTRFKKLVQKLEREVEKVDSEVGLKMKLLDTDNDGVMSLEEASKVLNSLAGEKNERAVAECLRRLDTDKDGNFSREDLRRVMRELQGEGDIADHSSTGKSTLVTKADTVSSGRPVPAPEAKEAGEQQQRTAKVSHSTE